MTIDVAEEPMTALAEYALLPIAFSVDQVLDVTARAEGGFALSARRLEVPYVKDYDAVAGEGPLHWSRRFDVSNWTLFGLAWRAALSGLPCGRRSSMWTLAESAARARR